MSWASRRQFKYFSILVLFLGFIVFLILSPKIFKKPTCFDQKQNGKETGIDCGGSCARLCKADVYEPVVLWNRAFRVTGNDYHLVAFIENRNKSSAVYEASYEFRVYDSNNKYIGRREGKTYIPPNQQFAILESRFDSGLSDIKSVSFEFIGDLAWVKKESKLDKLAIRINNIVIDNNQDTPSLSATINNDSVYDIGDFDIVAILYDENKNAINVSKTRKSKLKNNSSLPVYFTWTEAFATTPVTQDILIQINPFKISF